MQEPEPVRQALQQRYVLCAAADHVVATGMIQFPTEPRFERAPAGTVRMAITLLGYRAAGRLLLMVARSLLGSTTSGWQMRCSSIALRG